MTCRCTVNTLSLFIRNVAHVDVLSSRRHATRQLQQSSTRNVASRSFTGSFLSSRAYSSAASSEDGTTEPQPKKPSQSSIAEFSLDAIDSILEESSLNRPPVREADPERKFGYETPLKSLLKDIPQKKPREDWVVKKSENARTFTRTDTSAPGENGSKTTIRRTGGPPNTGPTIHFDNPRAPRRDMELRDAMPRSRTPVGRELNSQPRSDGWVPPPREPWMIEKERAKEKYPDGYKPMKKLSPDAMAGIRALHAQMPEYYTTWALSQEFEVSPESIRRILKSKWTPNSEEETERQKRWFKRGKSVWTRYAELNIKPPKKWRDLGIGNGKPEWMLRRQLEQDRPAPPALVTTARRNEQKYESGNEAESSLADKIL
ncbi:hypothetical protein BKA61DRAFT_166650 [Leptodontidium sp. MPI-SDFR-AT-0119]|nr:hypothetical protein BKA61DRAFT_166650 [Leptodontidium sp. MPI-SDFR-AT-0119]